MNIFLRICGFIFSSYLMGCSIQPLKYDLELNSIVGKFETSPTCESYENHIIAIDKRGGFLPINFKSLTGNKCEITIEKLQSDKNITNELAKIKLEKVLKQINQNDKNVFIFIHGGLNTYEVSLARAFKDINEIVADGKLHPVFIIWPSGALDTYSDSITSYFQGGWDRSLDFSMFPFKVVTDLMEIPAQMMANYATSFRLTVNSYCLSEFSRDGIMPIPCRNAERANLQDYFLTNDPCENGAKKRAGFYCVKEEKDDSYSFIAFNDLITLPAKLITIPISNPLAKRGWNSMQGRIRFAFRTPCPDDTFTRGNCAPGFIYNFFEELRKSKDFGNKQKRITLFGHSMGTIVSGEIIREFYDLPYDNVIFAGAAISVREFKNTVEDALKKKVEKYLEYSKLIEQLSIVKNSNNRSDNLNEIITNLKTFQERNKPFKFYNLSLHPYAEATEDNIKGLVPHGSLLEWIDLHIENPADGLDKTLGKWANITPLLVEQGEINDFFDASLLESGCMYFSRLGLDPEQPLMHGDFANSNIFKYWKSESWLQGTGLGSKNCYQETI